MRQCVRTLLALVLVSGNVGSQAAAQTTDATQDDQEPLVVAVRQVPPFAVREADGDWTGLSVELWQNVAHKLDRPFQWVEMPLNATLDALAAGEVDVAAAALTITAERERRFDFSHPYYVGGLSLAYRSGQDRAWRATLRGFLSPAFLSAVGTLLFVLLVAGVALWLFERRRNAEQFGRGRALQGMGDGFWWSAVTMTTVGYGDKAPQTLGGRIVALLWMFTSLIIIASLTASIAASLTTNQLESSLLADRSLADLDRVGVLTGSAAQSYAEARGATTRTYPSIEAALDALSTDEVKVVLHDAPILKHFVRQYDGLEVAPRILVRDDYGLGLRDGSPIREDVNAALLSILREPVWGDLLRRHLGETTPD